MAAARAARPTALAARTAGRRRHMFVRAARVVVAEPPLSTLLHDDPWVCTIDDAATSSTIPSGTYSIEPRSKCRSASEIACRRC
eukprot:1901000-Prymnesium_polylepis.1